MSCMHIARTRPNISFSKAKREVLLHRSFRFLVVLVQVMVLIENLQPMLLIMTRYLLIFSTKMFTNSFC
uniref:Uncharacterized protein n=1 Tax=Arundo donax TaxID=35708 RepID=A0A0A9CB75_ARUDO